MVALGGQSGSSSLREWAGREFHGYPGSGVDVPSYRKPAAAIQIDVTMPGRRITGQSVSPRQLPDPVDKHIEELVPLGHPIGEIEAMVDAAAANGGFLRMTLPRSQDVAALMNADIGDPYQSITAIYWSVGRPALQGVVDRVRTTLVELVAETRTAMPNAADAPSAAVADQA